LLGMLRGLEADFTVGRLTVGAGSAGPAAGESQSAREISDEALRTLINKFVETKEFLFLGCSFKRDDARLASGAFEETARAVLMGLLPVYKFIAWSRENDYLLMRETLKQEKQAKKQKHLAKNDRVRIVRGMFAGKTGQVQELDTKG